MLCLIFPHLKNEMKEKIIVLILAAAQIPGQMLKPLCG
jgi:hypothetical protein